jgi:hypothetical protein
MQVQPTNYIYVRAALQVTHSVIFAESAIALAAMVMHKLGYHQVTFLPDSLQLVKLLNSKEISDLPDWRMTHHIQMFQD